MIGRQESLLDQFRRQDIMTKIMIINGLVFLVFRISSALMSWSSNGLYRWFALPDDLLRFATQPWSLLTYSFLHSGFFHLLFNMIWLSFFGRFILNLFPARRFLSLYLLGGIFAGVVYIVSYNIFPAFLGTSGQLIGASGAVMAVMAFAALYSPNAPIRIFFISLKLWQLAVVMVLWDLFRLPEMNNAGGLLAHLGGAAFGYYYAKNLQGGRDIGLWFDRFLDLMINLLPKRMPKRTKSKRQSSPQKNNINQQKIDIILDKIGQSGYDSLTKEEKDFLFKSGQD